MARARRLRMTSLRNLTRNIADSLALRRDPAAWSRAIGVRVGARCRLIDVSRATFGSEPYLISLGDHVTVTEGVRFITHDGGVWIFRDVEPTIDVVAPISVGDNVFLGLRAIVLPGVHIGSNSIVAAGAVVVNDVEPGSVVGGVPAKFIKSVSDYRRDLRGQEVDTKGLCPEEKRRRLAELYRDESSGQGR